MKYRILAYCTLLILISHDVFAADFSGTWYGPYFYDHEYTIGLSGELTVVITQNNDIVNGTFTTVNGSSGSFSGSIDGNTLAASLTDPVNGEKADGTLKATLNNGLLIWECIAASNGSIQTLSGSLTKNWIRNAGH